MFKIEKKILSHRDNVFNKEKICKANNVHLLNIGNKSAINQILQ